MVVVLAELAEQEQRQKGLRVERTTTVEGVTKDVFASGLAVKLLAVGQRVLDAESMKRRAVEDATATKGEVREDVRVGIDDAVDRSVVEGARDDVPDRIDAQLRVLDAALDRLEGHDQRRLLVRDQTVRTEVAARFRMPQAKPWSLGRCRGRSQRLPLCAGHIGVVEHRDIGQQGELAQHGAVVGHEVAASLIVKKVGAEIGRLHEEARRLGFVRSPEGITFTVGRGRKQAQVAAAQGIAAVGELVDARLVDRGLWA